MSAADPPDRRRSSPSSLRESQGSLRGFRVARRNPLPEGTLSVGLGLVLGGIAQYGFLAISARALGPARYAPLATFWSLIFVCGPGFFQPLEQEVGRALAARRARGEGGRPLVIRAAWLGSALAAVLIVAAIALAGPLTSRLFNGDSIFVAALVAGLVAYLCEHIARGTLLGNAAFRPYGVLLGLEGLLRVIMSAGLGVIGVRVAGYFGLALVIASFLATALAVAGRRGLLRPGPAAPLSELSRALVFLLVSSFLTQFLLSIGTVAVQLLATPDQQAAAGRFLTTRIIAFIPIFLLQAVQAPLLSKLSALTAAGKHAEFRRVLGELLVVVVAFGAVSIVGLAVLGPVVTRLLFGGGFDLGNLDFALLGGACAFFMVSQVLNQTLISLSGYPRATAGWVTGAAAFVLVTALGSSLFLRVELGLLVGSIATAGVMGALLLPLVRNRHAAAAPAAREA